MKSVNQHGLLKIKKMKMFLKFLKSQYQRFFK